MNDENIHKLYLKVCTKFVTIILKTNSSRKNKCDKCDLKCVLEFYRRIM